MKEFFINLASSIMSRSPRTSAASSSALQPVAVPELMISKSVAGFPLGPCFHLLWSRSLFWHNVPHGFLQLALVHGHLSTKQHVYEYQPFVF